jgi:hypothetical protein
MMFKTEMHCHTAEVSPCAGFTASEVVEKYVEAGFSSLVITDHFRNYVVDHAGTTWRQKIDHYLAGYRKAQACANGRIHVLLGIELQSVGEHNDYLVYGITEDFLYDHPDIHKMTLKSFRAILPPTAMIFHAHAFRFGCNITDPDLLDGMEAYNGITADDNNAIADLWSKRYGLIQSSGSDYHGGSVASIKGGIATDEPIIDEIQLSQVLRARAYKLIKKREIEA